MSIKFKKSVDKEIRYILLEDLNKYETATVMTDSERDELYKWVADGNSPYDNPSLYYTESGWPMDFIEARRFGEDSMEQMLATHNNPERSMSDSKSFENDQQLEYPF
jgi:hypothetical protein